MTFFQVEAPRPFQHGLINGVRPRRTGASPMTGIYAVVAFSSHGGRRRALSAWPWALSEGGHPRVSFTWARAKLGLHRMRHSGVMARWPLSRLVSHSCSSQWTDPLVHSRLSYHDAEWRLLASALPANTCRFPQTPSRRSAGLGNYPRI